MKRFLLRNHLRKTFILILSYIQGYNARKVISVVYASFVLQCNTGRMSQPDMESIFQIKNQWNILVIWNYYVNYQNFQNLMRLTPRILNEHWCIYSCLQIPPRENWFQYVRRVYTTEINFPCIITLHILQEETNSGSKYYWSENGRRESFLIWTEILKT